MLVFLGNIGREMGILRPEVDTRFVKSNLAFHKFLK